MYIMSDILPQNVAGIVNFGRREFYAEQNVAGNLIYIGVYFYVAVERHIIGKQRYHIASDRRDYAGKRARTRTEQIFFQTVGNRSSHNFRFNPLLIRPKAPRYFLVRS